MDKPKLQNSYPENYEQFLEMSLVKTFSPGTKQIFRIGIANKTSDGYFLELSENSYLMQ